MLEVGFATMMEKIASAHDNTLSSSTGMRGVMMKHVNVNVDITVMSCGRSSHAIYLRNRIIQRIHLSVHVDYAGHC